MGFLLVIISTGVAATAATSSIVLGDDWCANAFHLFVLFLHFLRISLRIGVDPRLTILQCVHDLLLLLFIQLFTETLVLTRSFNSGAHRVQVAIEGVLGIDTLLDFLILVSELLGFLNHLLNLLFGETALVVGNGNLFRLTSGLILCADVQDAVGVYLECDLNLRLSSRSWRDSSKLELSKQVVVLSHRSLTLEDLDVHGRLVVLVGGEDLRLLGGNHCVAADELGHHSSDGLDTKSQWSHIEQQKVLAALTAQDS